MSVSLFVDVQNIIVKQGLSQLENHISPLPKISGQLGIIFILPPNILQYLDDLPLGNEKVQYINTTFLYLFHIIIHVCRLSKRYL